MWDKIIKGVLNGVGGGLSAAGNSSRTKLSENSSTETQNDSGMSAVGETAGLIGKLAKKAYDKKKQGDKE